MEKSTIENYIKQTIEYLKEDAIAAKEDYLNANNSNSKLWLRQVNRNKGIIQPGSVKLKKEKNYGIE